MTHSARRLDDTSKLAAVAAIAFVISLFLPWYGKSVLNPKTSAFVSDGISAFGAFTWVQASLILVNGGVLGLIYLRSQGRRVELPTSDGTIIAMAGGWMLLLLFVCVFDKPSVTGLGATIGVQWGLLVAIASAGGVLAAGLAGRAATRANHLPYVEPTAPTAVAEGFEAQVPPRWRRPRA